MLFDLGDFLDDYATNDRLRNDLGLLWLVTLDHDGPGRIEALPLMLEYCRTRIATGDERRLVAELLAARCAAVGTRVHYEGDRLVISP